MSAGWLIGIDGGGTGCRALIAAADDAAQGRAFEGKAGPANPKPVGVEAAQKAMKEAIAAAFAAAGEVPIKASALVAAVAGIGRENEQREFEAWALDEGIGSQVRFVGDATAVLAAGRPEGWGLAAISGTGSMAFGVDPKGRTARAGGWGYLLGDEGSGYKIAVEGLQLACRAADGIASAPLLLERLMKHVGANEPRELVGTLYGPDWTRRRIADLARVVLEVAPDEPAAMVVVDAEAAALVDSIAAVARQLPAIDRSAAISLAGGVGTGSPLFQRLLVAKLAEREFKEPRLALVPNPVIGALRLAAALARGEANPLLKHGS
ncbi:MAG TPA: BadF/BadG/BcrA/BcrD ATPase family protein [Planctomycetia bacterium]|nr:BadF/BadG/BcrA/BcrD ATPase family protein [Planctomycetia bacterium]